MTVDRSKDPSPSARALRAMGLVRWGLLAAVALAAVFAFVITRDGEGAAAVSRDELYMCPMHPQVRSATPGQCPICHMDLVPIDDAPAAAPSGHEHGAPPPGTVAVTLPHEQQRLIGLSTSLVERAALSERVRVPASVAAPDTGLAQVRVRAPGFLEDVVVRQSGVRVARGQTLAYVYSPDIYRAQEELIAASRWSGAGGAELAAAARRSLELFGVSPADVDTIAQSGKPMRAVPVRATASGYVTRLGAILGGRAEPEMVLYEIADLSTVWVIASVHEADVRALPIGAQASFWPTGASAPRLGRVALLEPFADEATRTVRARIVLANRDGALRPGALGEVELERPAAEGLFVPRDAIIHTGERSYVYVAQGADRFAPREVTTGLLRGERVLVSAGLSEGERIVTRGGFALDSESRLQAALAAPPAAPASAKEKK